MENLNNNKEKLTQMENIKRSLFFKSKERKKKEIPELKIKQYDVKDNWDKNKSVQEKMSKTKIKTTNKIGFLGKLVIFSIIFFCVSLGTAFFVFYKGVNVVSTENVDISISGPSSVGGGEELAFQITTQNNNSVDLELADLIIKYPEGTLSANDKNDDLTQIRKALNTVPAGSSVTNMFKVVVFGNEGSVKEILITIEYRAKGSNAVFFKERKYEIMIDSSPVVFAIDCPAEAMTGQDFICSIDITSNSNKVIKDFLFVADYPFGFAFKKSNIKPSYKDNVWSFDDIQPNSKTTLKIEGVLGGQDKEEKVFKFYGGVEDKENKNEIKAKLVSVMESILIKKTFIGADLVLNGDYGAEYVSSSDKNIRADILWSNNLPVKLTDMEISVKLNGIVFDEASVSHDSGFYRSIDNTILWKKGDEPQLAILNPGDNGNLSFSFFIFPLSYISNSRMKNSEIDMELIISANKLTNDGMAERIETKLSKIIKINTDLILTAQTLRSIGKFENSGPIPPKVDTETSYTIVWTAMNTSNDISNAKVVASLPSYVKWTGNIYPKFENISFNPVGGEIVWNIGNIKAGDGVTTMAQEVSFQVILEPSLSQFGLEPILVDNIFIEGLDNFTNKIIKYPVRAVNTRFSTDPLYNLGDEDVVR
ncbi:MAG: hypothetical protein ABIG87_01720 [Patescibacteria group bacterium]